VKRKMGNWEARTARAERLARLNRWSGDGAVREGGVRGGRAGAVDAPEDLPVLQQDVLVDSEGGGAESSEGDRDPRWGAVVRGAYAEPSEEASEAEE
jgi:hypothetical protein